MAFLALLYMIPFISCRPHDRPNHHQELYAPFTREPHDQLLPSSPISPTTKRTLLIRIRHSRLLSNTAAPLWGSFAVQCEPYPSSHFFMRRICSRCLRMYEPEIRLQLHAVADGVF